MQLDDPTALALLAADALRRAGIDHALDDAASVLATLGSEIDRERIEAEVLGLQEDVPDHPVVERWRRACAG